LTLQDAAEAYVAELRVTGRSPMTISVQGCLVRRMAKGMGPQRFIVGIMRRELVHYLGDLIDNGASQRYLAGTAKVYHRFFSWLVERHEIKENPMDGLSVKMPPDEPVIPFTDDEYRRLIQATQTPLERVTMLILVDTGLRAGEILSLRLDSIDFRQGELVVRGKGNKVRRVALSSAVQNALKIYLASRAQVNGALWPETWHRKSVGTLVDRVARKARVARCHPHRFRHSWAARLRREGVDILVLQKLLGHSSLKTTQRYTLWAEQETALEVHRRHSIIPK